MLAGGTRIVYRDTTTSLYSLTDIASFCALYFTSAEQGTKALNDTNLKVVCLTPDGTTVWSTITAVTKQELPIGTSMTTVTLVSGRTLNIKSDASILHKQNNFFVPLSLSQWNPSMGIASSLYLPTRVASQGKTFTVDVEMQNSAQDPQALIPVSTNTWGDVQIPFQLLPEFMRATTDPFDKETFEVIRTVPVTFNQVEFVESITTQTSTYAYMLHTSNGNFMLANGIFVVSPSI